MKKHLRIITFAWGRQYASKLLDITLPAVLSPGNLPALTEVFDCEFIVLTERGLFTQIQSHPVYHHIASITKARCIAIDDLVIAPFYGLTLTWALFRAMEDLGDAITDTDFLFFHADFIPADGSYRTLIPHLLNRERLIVAPSYCVVSEKVLPILQARVDPKTHVLTMSKREMAEVAIPNRHNTIRGKTINTHLFHMDIIEQFYWLVDPHTLLGHQMPIAIVCMRPERWIPEPNSFWDYGTVSELCPNVTPCVLGDSDDFLMIEMRSESTYDDSLRMGWPDIDTIGSKLAGFVTRDHTVYGRHQLVLHSRDLPPDIDAARAQLKAFVDKVFEHFDGKEISHIGHPFWNFQSALFDLAKNYSDLNAGCAEGHPLWSFFSKALTGIIGTAINDYRRDAATSWQSIAHALPSLKGQGIDAYVNQRDPLNIRLSQALTAIEQAVKSQEAIHQRDIALALQDVRELRQLISEDSRATDYKFNKATGSTPFFTEVPATTGTLQPRNPLRRLLGCIKKIGRHHPMWAPMRHALRILNQKLSTTGDIKILYIASDGADRLSQCAPLAGRSYTRMATFSAAYLEPGDLPWHEHFDLCVFDLDLEDIQRLRRIYDNVSPALRLGGKAIAFYFHQPLWRLGGNPQFIRHVFPRCDYGHVYYAGSWLSMLTIRGYRYLNRRVCRPGTRGHRVCATVLAVFSSIPAMIANWHEARRPLDACLMPPLRPCTSMTIDIDV